METTQHKQRQAELKALMEDEEEAREERKQLKAYFKRSAEAASATFGCSDEISMEQRTEVAEAANKKDDKRYRENAKAKRRKKAEVAQADEQAFDSKQRCLEEWHEGRLEALKYDSSKTNNNQSGNG